MDCPESSTTECRPGPDGRQPAGPPRRPAVARPGAERALRHDVPAGRTLPALPGGERGSGHALTVVQGRGSDTAEECGTGSGPGTQAHTAANETTQDRQRQQQTGE